MGVPWLKNDLDGGIDNTGSSESSEGLARLTRQHHFVLSSVVRFAFLHMYFVHAISHVELVNPGILVIPFLFLY